MSIIETIEAVRSGLMWIGLSALAAIAVGIVCTWLYRGVASAMRRPLAVARIIAFVAVSAFCVIRGGAKFLMPPPSTGGTPVVPVMQSPATGGTPVVPEVVTPEEIARGWRLESVTTNDAVSYAMPTNGVEYAPWSRGGGYETHFPLDLGDFAFPFGTGVVRRLDVLSGGMVESLPRQREGDTYHSLMSICAAREWASIVPGVGRFWWAETARPESAPYRGKVLTWENVYAGRDRTGQYNAQIELWGDGNFITRSNDVERVYRRVLPYDLDNDGLPNTIDPAPETPVIPSAWNQSEEWAAAAFPSNAAEIAAMGGYAAWVAARGAEPDRRLVSLGLVFDGGSVWPTLLDFGGVPVVADGMAELVFAIDCGAKVPFTLTSGRLGSLAVTATEPPTRSGEGMTTTESSVIQNILDFPYERSVGDVKLYLDGPRSGWLCRTASVSVDGDEVQHLFPGDTIELTASVTGCHPDAYLGCTWHGGSDITFSNSHSLTTDVTYASASTVVWATNGINLVTQFLGYTLTNRVPVTVGTDAEPPLAFSLGCQKVFFLNDADFLEGACPSNRPERIRPVTLNLTGPIDTNGTTRLSVQGNVNPVLFQVVDGVTNRVTSETVFPLAVTDDFAHTGSSTFYMSCPNLGTGTITATFTPADGGEPLTDSVTFRCIEPLRKLVTTETKDGRYVNPSRLVMGTNAVLKVEANGPFSPSEVNWRVVSGPGRAFPTNGWETTVTPTGIGTVTVEARFNDDEIQPQFVLPVVQPRTIPVKAFVVKPPKHDEKERWEQHGITSMLDTANEIFTQVGIQFELIGIPANIDRTNDWILASVDIYTNSEGKVCHTKTTSRQAAALFSEYEAAEGVTMYFVGAITNSSAVGFRSGSNVVIGKESPQKGLAHELGHYLGLKDIYYAKVGVHDGKPANIRLRIRNDPVSHESFRTETGDWGHETGRGFYASGDTLASIIGHLLMHGVVNQEQNDVGDIPDNQVYGISKDDKKGFQNVGASNFDD